jgi:hypothetical protein
MNVSIDWIMAMTVFILLVAWSFTYYAGLFDQASQPVSNIADTINDKIVDFLETDSYDVIVRHNLSAVQSDAIIHLNMTWPDQTQNTVQVHSGTSVGNNLTCNITNGELYWKSDLVAGENFFLVHFSNRTASLNCTSTQAQVDIYASDINNTVAWAMVKRNLFAQSNIDRFNSTHASYIEYNIFKSNENIEREFRVEIYNETSLLLAYGRILPLGSNVYTRETWSMIEESREKINMSVMAW